MNSRPVFLSSLDSDIEPLIWMVDNPMRCEKMGLVFEVNVGAGKLLVASIDLLGLLGKHPEADTLLDSLLRYLGSDAFQPAGNATVEQLQAIFG